MDTERKEKEGAKDRLQGYWWVDEDEEGHVAGVPLSVISCKSEKEPGCSYEELTVREIETEIEREDKSSQRTRKYCEKLDPHYDYSKWNLPSYNKLSK